MEGFIFCTFSSPTGWLDKQTNNDWAEVGKGGHSTRWVIRSTHGCHRVCCMNSFLLGIEAIVCLLTAFHDVRVSSQWKRATQTWGFPGQWTYQASEHPVLYQEPWFEKDLWIYYLWTMTYLVLFAFKLYRIQMNCVEVCRSVGILSFLSVKNKIEKQMQERYFRFQKSEQSHRNEKQHVNDVCRRVYFCHFLCLCLYQWRFEHACGGFSVCVNV